MNNINFQTKIILQTLFKHTDCIDRVVIFFLITGVKLASRVAIIVPTVMRTM